MFAGGGGKAKTTAKAPEAYLRTWFCFNSRPMLNSGTRASGTVSAPVPHITVLPHNYFFLGGGGGLGHGTLPKPAHQKAIKKSLESRISAVQCYDCPTRRRGSGHDTWPYHEAFRGSPQPLKAGISASIGPQVLIICFVATRSEDQPMLIPGKAAGIATPEGILLCYWSTRSTEDSSATQLLVLYSDIVNGSGVSPQEMCSGWIKQPSLLPGMMNHWMTQLILQKWVANEALLMALCRAQYVERRAWCIVWSAGRSLVRDGVLAATSPNNRVPNK